MTAHFADGIVDLCFFHPLVDAFGSLVCVGVEIEGAVAIGRGIGG